MLTSESHPPVFSVHKQSCVDLTVTVASNCTCIAGKDLPNVPNQPVHLLSSQFPSQLNSLNQLLQIMSSLSKIKICIGNPDEKFEEIRRRHEWVFKDRFGKSNLHFA